MKREESVSAWRWGGERRTQVAAVKYSEGIGAKKIRKRNDRKEGKEDGKGRRRNATAPPSHTQKKTHAFLPIAICSKMVGSSEVRRRAKLTGSSLLANFKTSSASLILSPSKLSVLYPAL